MLKTAAFAVVGLHLLVVILHGLAHEALGIDLSPNQLLFAIMIITVAPLLAGVLIWMAQNRLGSLLLVLSMGGSFVFGFWNHFAVPSLDHVSHVSDSAGFWAGVFIVTAYLLAFSEVAGTVVGTHLFFRKHPSAM